MGVVGSADVTGAEVERIVERPQGAGEVLLELAAEAIAAQPGQRRGGAEAGFRAVLAAGRTGGDGDDPAGGAAAVDGAAATDHLDPLDQRRVDVGQVARGVAVGVQRHAVDHHQHAAPAQGLAVFGDGAAGIGHPRHRLGQHGGQAVGALAQLLQLGMLDDGGLARGGDQVAAGARGGDFHLLHVQRFAAGLRSGHGGFAGRNDDEGMFVPGLRLQAAIPEQLAQCFFGGETPLQRRRLAASAEIAGERICTEDCCARALIAWPSGAAGRSTSSFPGPGPTPPGAGCWRAMKDAGGDCGGKNARLDFLCRLAFPG